MMNIVASVVEIHPVRTVVRDMTSREIGVKGRTTDGQTAGRRAQQHNAFTACCSAVA